jgi:DNA-directed RNA polymerase specialized sigma subunit
MQYEKVVGLITSRVQYWSTIADMDYDDLLSVAHEIFVDARTKYQPNRGAKFSSYLYMRLNSRFNQLRIKQEKRWRKVKVMPDQFIEMYCSTKYQPERQMSFKQMLTSLSAEAMQVVNIVLNTPAELIELARGVASRKDICHVNKTLLSKYLQGKGWKVSAIDKVFAEIREGLNGV